VIGVSALGPSGAKAGYSNYGIERISVAAPGGWSRDGLTTSGYGTDNGEILSAYPKKVLQSEQLVDAAGSITTAGSGHVYKDCAKDGRCGYYTYLQGTSMAAPHAAGVAALIVSRFGHRYRARRGRLRLSPSTVESVLVRTAAAHACPVGDATCVGDTEFNSFYGSGIVDAYAAVTAEHVR